MPCDYSVITGSGSQALLAEIRAPLCCLLPLWRGRMQLVWRIMLKVDATGREQRCAPHCAGEARCWADSVHLPRYCCMVFVTIRRCHENASALHLSWACPENWWESEEWAALKSVPRTLTWSGLILPPGKWVVKQSPCLLWRCPGFHHWNDAP